MKVKVLKLSEAAKKVEVEQGALVQHVIEKSGFNRVQMTITPNEHPHN